MISMVNKLKKLRMFLLKKIRYRHILKGPCDFTIGRGTGLYAPNTIYIGNNVYVGKYCSLECDMDIGDNVLIANQVGIIGRYDHQTNIIGMSIKDSPWIGNKEYNGKGLKNKTIIESDVWIGYNATILSGIKIGRGAIVGAHSLIIKDVEPYSIVCGNPAKKIKMRFTPKQIIEHEKLLYKG